MIGGLGWPEILLIGVALLVLFGAKKLPEIGKSLGRGLREFKKATNEMSSSFSDGLKNDENKKSDENVIETTAQTEDVKKSKDETKASV